MTTTKGDVRMNNSIAPNSNFKIKDFDFSLREKGFNMDLEENSAEFSQIENQRFSTSPNPNIMCNLKNG